MVRPTKRRRSTTTPRREVNVPAEVGVASYRPGAWVAVIGSGVWLLVSGSAGEPLLRAAWGAAREKDAPAQVEQLLRREIAANARSFAFVAVSGTGLTVLLSGEAVAEAGP